MILLRSLLSILLTLAGTRALQCYSFERSFHGPFDLSSTRMSIVDCVPGQEACLEAVTSLSTGYRNSITLVKKGCSYGPGSGEMMSGGDSLPPDFTLVRRCHDDLCNRQIENHESIPNLSPAPNPPELSGIECWACVSSTPEGCELHNAHKVKCHGGQNVCFQGHGFLALENFSSPVYMRTCHEPGCTFTGAATHWSDNYLKGTCCKGDLCNNISNVPKAHSGNPAPSGLAKLPSGAPGLPATSLLLAIPFLFLV